MIMVIHILDNKNHYRDQVLDKCDTIMETNLSDSGKKIREMEMEIYFKIIRKFQ